MTPRKKKSGDDGPAGPGEWIVTFSDCMTLLLCFFVLLLTFSSFDEVELQRLAGAFDCESHDSIFPVPREVKDSSVPPVPREVDITDQGTDVPTDAQPENNRTPRMRPPILVSDAYKDRKVFYLPCEWLFWGEGTVMTPEGKAYLKSIADFLAVLPARVVLGEQGSDGAPGRLDRATAVLRFLAAARMPTDRLHVSAQVVDVPPRLRGRRVLTVTVLSREVY